MPQDINLDQCTLYHQPLRAKPTKIALEQTEQEKDSEIEDEPPMVEFPKPTVQPQNAVKQPPYAAAFPGAINPNDDLDDGPTPPPVAPPQEILPPKPRQRG